MDGHRFDAWTRHLASSQSRRTLLRGLAGGALAAVGLGRTAQARCPREQPISCGGTCVDLRTDPANCGRCEAVCPHELCYAGRCLSTCPSGFEPCGGTCVRSCPGDPVLEPEGCATAADCEAVDPCTPAACVEGVCNAASSCADYLTCLRARDCTDYTCESTGCSGICPCPRVGPFTCDSEGVVDLSDLIQCHGDDGPGPI